MVAGVCLMGLSLTGCEHYSRDLSSLDGKMKKNAGGVYASVAAPVTAYNAITPAAGIPMAGAPVEEAVPMNTYLAQEYYDLARYENDVFDYKAARIFTAKSMAAAKGDTVRPCNPAQYDLSTADEAALRAARGDLVTALKTKNTPATAALLAKAQARFDCWVERAEEATNEKHAANCRSDFEQTMAALSVMDVAPAAGMPVVGTPVQTREILFPQNSVAFNPDAVGVITQTAAFLTSPAGQGYTVSLNGFAGTTGASEYASKLAVERIAAVKAALAAKGVAESAFQAGPAAAQTSAVAAGMIPMAGGTVVSSPLLARKVEIVLTPPVAMPAPVAPVSASQPM